MKLKPSVTPKVNLKPSTTRSIDPNVVAKALGAEPMNPIEYFGRSRPRVPDSLWLTPRCQRIVNDFNAGRLDEESAVFELRAVGNTVDQAKEILERHRGRDPVKVKAPKKTDPLRRVKG